jgi:hypothetical protein
VFHAAASRSIHKPFTDRPADMVTCCYVALFQMTGYSGQVADDFIASRIAGGVSKIYVTRARNTCGGALGEVSCFRRCQGRRCFLVKAPERADRLGRVVVWTLRGATTSSPCRDMRFQLPGHSSKW